MKKLYILICLSLSLNSFAQVDLNNYKYVIVPEAFEFLKEPNQYQLNALTEFLFNKYDFTAVMENASMPEDLSANICLALRANVLNESGLFTTKLKVELKDCKNQLVYTSEIGSSKEKEYKKAYQEALREAFESIEALGYEYNGNAVGTAPTPVVSANTQPTNTVPATAAAVTAPVAANASSGSVPNVDNSEVLYAQAISNGYQLVDRTPKVVYKLKQTNTKDLFLVEGQQAMVRKSGDTWVLEYYEGDELKTKTLNIKF